MSNISADYREFNISPRRSGGLTEIKSIAYNGTFWIIAGKESIKRTTLSTYPGVMGSLKNYYKWGSVALVELMNNKPTSFNFYKNNAESFYAMAEKEYQVQQSFNKQTTSYTFNTTHTMAISFDGKEWTLIKNNPFAYNQYIPPDKVSSYTTNDPPTCNGIAWNGSMWVAVGTTGGQLGFQTKSVWDGDNWVAVSTIYPPSEVATSTDGVNWYKRGKAGRFSQKCHCVAASSTLWVIGGDEFINNIDSDGYGCISTSTDGITWTPRQTPTGPVYGVAYNGNLWVAVGKDGTGLGGSRVHNIATSTDGISWTGRVVNSSQNPVIYRAVAWNGTKWMAVGGKTANQPFTSSTLGIISTSDDGITWTHTDFDEYLTSVCWNGVRWIIGGEGIFTSSDGESWSNIVDTTNYINTIASKIVLPITGGTPTNISSIISTDEEPIKFLISENGEVWKPNIPFFRERVNLTKTIKIKSIIYDGNKWITTGGNLLNNNIFKSTDGIDWTYGNTGSVFDNGKVIDYNGTLYVCLLEKTRSLNDIATSTNSTSWTKRLSKLEVSDCIAHSNSLWVVGGTGIQYSTNGTTWTKSATCPLTAVNTVAWNGSLWLAGGIGTPECIAASTDGIRWYSTNVNKYLSNCKSISWNRNTWIAVGTGDENNILTSVDGFNWTPVSTMYYPNGAKISAWDGTKFLVYGDGPTGYITSVDNGLTWQTGSNSEIESITAFSSKTVQLPITGTSSSTVLTKVNEGVAIINALRNVTLAEEEAAQKLINDQIAQAADAALRASKISSAGTKRTTATNWKNKIIDDWTPLTSKTYIDLASSYPTEYTIALDIYEQILEFHREIEIYYTRVTDSSQPTSVLVEYEGYISTRLDEITGNLIEFYNNIRLLYGYLFDGAYAFVTDTSTTTIIENFGFSTQDKNSILAFFNLKKNALLTLINNSKTSTLNVAITSTTNIPNFKTLHDTVLFAPQSVSLSNTYQTDTTMPFLFLRFLRLRYAQVKETKDICDSYYQDSIEYGQNWLALISQQFDTTQLETDFSELYNKYFYDVDELFTPKFYDAKYPKFFFDAKRELYKSIAKYPTVIQYIANQISTKRQQILADISTTKTYLRSTLSTLRSTLMSIDSTFRPYAPFFTKYNDLNLVEFANKVSEFSGRETSIYQRCVNLETILGYISQSGNAIHDAIIDVKIADAEAEEDGCTPPKTGWGGITNNLAAGDRGTPGTSGWVKFNETYYARERLARLLQPFQTLSPQILSDILDVINNANPVSITNDLAQLVEEVDDYVNNNEFSTEYVDSLYALDYTNTNSLIVQEYRSVVITAIQALKSSIQLNLPSQQGLTDFGDLILDGTSTTLTQYVSDINSTFSSIDSFIATNVSNYTIQQCQSLMTDAKNAMNSILAAQNLLAYKNLLNKIVKYYQDYPVFVERVELFEKRVQRFNHLYDKTLSEPSYRVVIEDTNEGKDFIISVPPTNEYFWVQRNATTVTNTEQTLFIEAEYDSNLGKYTVYNPIDITQYDSYSATQPYIIGDRTVYQSKLYECILDGTPEGQVEFKGGEPGRDTDKWKKVEYPIVTFLDRQVEARPENFLRLSSTNFLNYDPTLYYKYLDYVSFDSKVYICYQDLLMYPKLKNVPPTNSLYWMEVTYPMLEYADSYFSGIVEASPTKLTALDPNNFEEYSSIKRYFKSDAVSFVVNTVKKVYECVYEPINGIVNVSPTDNPSYWTERQYPSVFVNGVRTFAASAEQFPFEPLNISTISEYNSNTEYLNGVYVKQNNKIYYSTISGTSIKNIETTNTNYWKEIQFPHVLYNGSLREITPLTIPALDPNDFDEYQELKVYKVGDRVSYLGSVYECYDDLSVRVPIKNILPTNTTYWKPRVYEDVVTMEGDTIEADPSNFKQLNELDYHEYDNNWMYNVGDFVSYNSHVYQCVNVSPSVLHTSNITNIHPTNTAYWNEETTVTLESLGIFPWNIALRYSVGTVVTYQNDFYICEESGSGFVPSIERLAWKLASASEIFTDYDEYNSSTSYTYGNRVFVRTPNTTDIKFYICYSTNNNELQLYEYADILMTSELDGEGFNKYIINDKTWNKRDVPRYGIGYKTDPFAMIGFARETRRKFAMNVEMPFNLMIKMYSTNINEWKTTLQTLSPRQNDSTTLSLINRINGAADIIGGTDPRLKNSSISDIMIRVTNHAYANVLNVLKDLTNVIIAEQRKINDLKTGYFNNPFVQRQVYLNPYKYLNHVAETVTPNVRQFKDLGVGNIDEMNYEIYVLRNQMNYTKDSIDIYNEKTGLINTSKDIITDALLQAKQMIGYTMFFQMKNSVTKMGAAVFADSTLFYPIPVPICDYQATSPTLIEYPASTYPILNEINVMMQESVRPPAYVTDRDLATALTWESQNPTIKALGKVAKGLVGLVAAGAENFTSPQGLFDLMELGAKVATWNFDTKVLTGFPEFKYPTFRELSENRVNYKRLVKKQRQLNDQDAPEEGEEIRLGVIITQLASLLFQANEDFLRTHFSRFPNPSVSFSDNATTAVTKSVSVPVVKVDPPIITTPRPTTLPPVVPPPDPPVPPTKFRPIPPPRKPSTLIEKSVDLLKNEIDFLESELANARNRVRVIKKLPVPAPIEASIIDTVRNDPAMNPPGGRRYKHQITSNQTFIRTAGNLTTTGKAGLVAPDPYIPRQIPVARITPIKPDANVLEKAEALRAANERLLAEAAEEQAQAALKAEIDDIEHKLKANKAQLSIVEAENIAIQAANKERMAIYQAELDDAVQRNIEGRRAEAIAHAEYEQELAAQKAAAKKYDLEVQIRLEQKRAAWINSRNEVTASRDLLDAKKAQFAEQLLEDVELKGLINTKIGLAIRARYTGVINSITSSSTAKAVTRAYRTSYVRIATSPIGRKFSSFANHPKVSAFKQVLLGPLIEVAGIGLTAWQNGAFTEDEEV